MNMNKLRIIALLLLNMSMVIMISCAKDQNSGGNGNGGGNNSGGGGNGTNNDHTYVDLGLPSGTLWATCNVGAISSEGYGDYFAWGEVETKENYVWNTYKYSNGEYNRLTKYCACSELGDNGFVDDLTVLQPCDDPASTKWGSDWCMPTKEQWMELYNNTLCYWTSQNDVVGMLFCASNGNKIFLPGGGYRYSTSGNSLGVCYYWSSSLNENSWGCHSEFAYEFNPPTPSDINNDFVNTNYRFCGLPVRPVRSNQ